MSLQESIHNFEQYLRRRSPDRRTPVDYSSDVRQFVAVCDKPWREVTMHDIDGFVDGQRQAGLSPATIKRRVAALKVFFDFLAEENDDLAWPNPVRSKRHAGRQPKRLPRDLSDQVIEQVWAAIDEPRDRAWFALMLRGGLRVGEVVSLRLEDVLTGPQRDQPARLRVEGKGRKERVILLNADAYALLAAWLQVRPASNQPHIFLNERGQPLTVSRIEWLLHRYGSQAGLTLTPHQLRHTFARQVTEAGMPITSLSKLLGHAQITTTQIYTAGADPQLAQAYQAAMAQLAAPAQVAAPPSSPAPSASTVLDLPAVALPPLPDLEDWAPGLPTDIRQRCLDQVQRCLPTWKPQRRRQCADMMLHGLRHFWTWQMAQRPIAQLSQLSLTDLHAYQQAELARGEANATINRRLDYVLAVVRAEADAGYPVQPNLMRYRELPRPDSLPRHLSPEAFYQLETFMRSRLDTDEPLLALENACYFVLAHSGLRASECINLLYQDLDLTGQRLWVREGKGRKDRLVYLSPVTCQAIARYLGGNQRPPLSLLWTKPDGRPIDRFWLCRQIARLGQAVGVLQVSPHRLRHSLATYLLNAGMDITRIQKLLGHNHLSTTQIYARVADTTVEADYRQTMQRIERQQMPLSDIALPVADWPSLPVTAPARLDNSV
jgi:integrase/recombinase XerC